MANECDRLRKEEAEIERRIEMFETECEEERRRIAVMNKYANTFKQTWPTMDEKENNEPPSKKPRSSWSSTPSTPPPTLTLTPSELPYSSNRSDKI